MTIVDQIQTAREQLQTRARDFSEAAVAAARGSALGAAERVATAKQPIRTLAVAGQRLSSLSNRYFEQLFGQQAHTLEGVIEAGAERLKRAAKARNLREFIDGQRTLGAAGRERLAQDFKAAWKIATDTGNGLRELATDTYAELIHGVQTRRSPAARTTRKSTARKSTRARKAR